MAISKENIVNVDILSGTIHRSFMNNSIGEGDAAGDRIGVRVMKGSQPASLSTAACIGYFIRPDGITLVINGTISGNTAYVDLPLAAYAKTGQFALAIKVSGTGYAETLRIVDGTVVDTTTGEISDPAGDVPSLEELMAVISAAEAAAATIDGLSITATQISGTRYKIAVTKE